MDGYTAAMRMRGPIGLGLSLVLCWALLAWCTSTPPNDTDYRTLAGQSAQAALSAVRTAAVAGRAALDGRMLDPYFATVLRDATEAVAGAQKELAGEQPPGARARALRDELAPLLVAAGQRLGDLASARSRDDRSAQRSAVDELDRLGDRLADFVEQRT